MQQFLGAKEQAERYPDVVLPSEERLEDLRVGDYVFLVTTLERVIQAQVTAIHDAWLEGTEVIIPPTIMFKRSNIFGISPREKSIEPHSAQDPPIEERPEINIHTKHD